MTGRRAYKSPLREEQSKQTRERIVDGLIEQLDDTGRSDFAMNEVAERAGVSVRTIYRHFPTREDLLDAVQDRIDRSAVRVPVSDTADLPRHVDQLLEWFEAHPELVEASHVTDLGREVRRHSRRRRSAHTKNLIDGWLADLTEGEREMVFGAFRAFMGSATWRTMRSELQMSPVQTRQTFQWVLGLMLDDIERRLAAAREGSER